MAYSLFPPQWKREVGFFRTKATIVTAYFQIASKHSHSEYLNWIRNSLSLQDAMVIFTSSNLSATIRRFRQHALNRTVIIEMDLQELWIAKKQPLEFWKHQLEIDPERTIHRSFELFWIWLSKTWFVNTAIKLNAFESDIFIWSDIGCFRNQAYYGRTWVNTVSAIPKTSMLMICYQKPHPVDTYWLQKSQHYQYISGSQMAGYASVWTQFNQAFYENLDEYIERSLFVGEDQIILQSTCLKNPSLCTFALPNRSLGDPYFTLQAYLYNSRNVPSTISALVELGPLRHK